MSTSRAHAATSSNLRVRMRSCELNENDAVVVRGFSKHQFRDDANLMRARKESRFRFMDRTWIAFMICTV